MIVSRGTVRLGLAVIALLALLAPALWNGFPLLFADTGGYLARAFERDLEMGRSALYGAFLFATIPFAFWPVIVIQAALCIWLIGLTLRTHDLMRPLWLPALLTVALAAVTGIAFYAAQLIPDIFVPLSVLALHLLAFRNDRLTRWGRASLIILIAVAIACHMTILALTLALLTMLAIVRVAARRLNLLRPVLLLPAIAIAAGIFLSLFSNLLIGRQFSLTPGGTHFIFGRMVQDGIVARYLADRCPDETIRLCAYRSELPDSTDEWLWAPGTAFYKLGGPQGYEAEARRIVKEAFVSYPFMQLRAAIAGTFQQLILIETMTTLAEGDNVHTLATLRKLTPELLPRIDAAEQQRRRALDLSFFNDVHVPAGFLAMAFLGVALVIAWRRRRAEPATALLFVVTGSLVANAAISAVFSNPVDRYQSRLIWLLPLALFIFFWPGRRKDAL